MDYPTHRPITKKLQSIRQKHANGNNFADHNSDFFTDNIFSNPKEKPISQTQIHPQEHTYTQPIRKTISQSVFFNDQLKTTTDHTENYPFFQQNQNLTNKQFTRTQPHYSEDEEYFDQNQ